MLILRLFSRPAKTPPTFARWLSTCDKRRKGLAAAWTQTRASPGVWATEAHGGVHLRDLPVELRHVPPLQLHLARQLVRILLQLADLVAGVGRHGRRTAAHKAPGLCQRRATALFGPLGSSCAAGFDRYWRSSGRGTRRRICGDISLSETGIGRAPDGTTKRFLEPCSRNLQAQSRHPRLSLEEFALPFSMMLSSAVGSPLSGHGQLQHTHTRVVSVSKVHTSRGRDDGDALVENGLLELLS
jgi:hypothetical protein